MEFLKGSTNLNRKEVHKGHERNGKVEQVVKLLQHDGGREMKKKRRVWVWLRRRGGKGNLIILSNLFYALPDVLFPPQRQESYWQAQRQKCISNNNFLVSTASHRPATQVVPLLMSHFPHLLNVVLTSKQFLKYNYEECRTHTQECNKTYIIYIKHTKMHVRSIHVKVGVFFFYWNSHTVFKMLVLLQLCLKLISDCCVWYAVKSHGPIYHCSGET
jgi:hypothetical protein